MMTTSELEECTFHQDAYQLYRAVASVAATFVYSLLAPVVLTLPIRETVGGGGGGGGKGEEENNTIFVLFLSHLCCFFFSFCF